MRAAAWTVAVLASLLVGPPSARAQLAPQRPGLVDVYYVGMAGWGGQDVFLSEARGAADIVGAAFRSPGRSSLLSNETSSGLPAATDAKLRETLKSVASVMDRKEDVLFLLVTTHGSPDGAALQRHGAVFDTLTPVKLARALDAAGVRNSVVVVSACYSGVFTHIASPDRLVITAARPDRPSFGCKDGNHWTYFGEAFFYDALRRENDLRKVFATARISVSVREKAKGFQPSEPQIAGGARVIRRLAGAR